MAEIAVKLLLERLISLIAEEGKLLGGLGRDVKEMKDDLETMRSFLQDIDSRGETDQRVKTWVKQVRDVAYDSEDALDEFSLRLVRPRKHGALEYLLHKLHYITQLKTRRRLAIEIQNIKARLKTISERSKAFSFTDIGEGITGANTTPNTWHDPRITSLYMDEAEVVGIEGPKKLLIGGLIEEELNLTIISVVGMGGLGKTTLVKKVYDSQKVNQHFDCRVWITVSMSPVVEELLLTTIKKVLKETGQQAPEEMDTMDVNDLIRVLQNQLWEKRYVIIFDDIWDINVWETMRFAFPNRKCGSRIIFTTRIGEVVKYSNYSYSLQPLSDQEAWRLFCMKAFPSSSNNESISCPEELEELSRNILKKCSGLPLAIVLIGGLLARKAKTVWEWKNVHDSVGAEMRDNYKLESLNRILMFSYSSLPYYLKPCFLYLSMFPEDYFIRRMTLIRLWIAEGFIEDKQGVTMEVVAGDYVNELISRSMIQIAELNDRGEVSSCRIHDLMREIIQLKCKEECFSTTINIGSEGMGSELHEKARRISIYRNTCENYDSIDPRCSRFRSLLMFQLHESHAQTFGDKFFRAFKLLRVLDLEGADLFEFPPQLVELIHLRYLSLRKTKITVLPKSVGKLKNLETLDLKQTSVSELPVEILKLQRLRHLLVFRTDYGLDTDSSNAYIFGVSVPTGIGNLTCLQKLLYLDVQHQVARDGGLVLKELQKLTQLRKLGITNLRSKDGTDLCLALEKMKHLRCLNIARSTPTSDLTEEEFLELELLISPPQLLNHLYLKGRLRRLPVWITNSLKNLTILVLQHSRLSGEEENDPLKAFQHMPNLVELYLFRAYDGEELCCSEVGGYKNLKKLILCDMVGLKRVRFMEGSMPVLRVLYIMNCHALEMVPHGIEHLSSLQQLVLRGIHPRLVERSRKGPISQQLVFRGMHVEKTRKSLLPPQEVEGEGNPQEVEGEDYWRVKHIPIYFHAFRNTEGTLVADIYSAPSLGK